MTDVTDPKDLQPTFEDTFDGLAFEALQILYNRQRKYGPENIRQQGLWGILTRIKDDKIERVRRAFNGVIRQGSIELDMVMDQGDDESFEDALFDIANYALIMISVHRGTWGRPMREDTDEIETLAAAHPDGVPQLVLTPEEEAAERARTILADIESDRQDQEMSLPGRLATGEDLDDLKDYLSSESIDDATPEEWDRAAASEQARERLERDRLARDLGGQD